jgi:hypothetical protein
VIQNLSLSRNSLISGTGKSQTGPNQTRMMDVPMLLFVSWPKISLFKVLCWKAHRHDAKSACPAQNLVFF